MFYKYPTIMCLYRKLTTGIFFAIANIATTAIIATNFIYVLTAYAQPNLQFEHVLPSINTNNLNIGTVTTMLQDSMGFMWFAGENIHRYDGVNFKNQTPPTGSPCSGTIRDIKQDKSDAIWILSDENLCVFNQEKMEFQPFSLHSAQNHSLAAASSLHITDNNELYIGLNNKLAIINSARNAIQFFQAPDKNTNSANDFRCILVDGNQVWIGSRSSGLMRFTPANGQFEYTANQANAQYLIPNNNIRSIAKDGKGNLWLASHEGGLSRINFATNAIKNYHPQEKTTHFTRHVWSLLIDSNGQLWVGSDGDGLLGYDETRDDFLAYKNDVINATSIASNKAMSLLEDSDGNIWVSLYPSGIELVDRKKSAIQTYYHHPNNSQSLNSNNIVSIFKDTHNNIWIGTEKGLNKFNASTKNFTNFSEQNSKHWHINASSITTIAEAQDGNLWLGTWSDGLFLVNPDTGNIKHFTKHLSSKNTIDISNIWAILPGEKTTWIAGDGKKGILIYDHAKQTFKREVFSTEGLELSGDHIYAMLKSKSGTIWIASLNGLYSLDTQKHLSLHSNYTQKLPGNTLPSFRIRSLYEASNGVIWIGTQDKGIFTWDPKTELFYLPIKNTAINTAHITRITSANDGSIWLFTTKGILRVNTDNSSFDLLTQNHGLASENIYRGAAYIDADDTVYAGGTNGLSIFTPKIINTKTHTFPVHITEISIPNAYKPNQEKTENKYDITHTNKKTLKHLQNSFFLEFSALSYPKSNLNEYAIKIDNIDHDWINIGRKTTIAYSNLSHGLYTFRVKAKDSYGIWSAQSDTFEIEILPPPWRTAWAYMVYVCVAALILSAAAFVLIKRTELKKQEEANQALAKLRYEKDIARRNFIADVSHELKTPIAILAGEIEAIEDGIRPLTLSSISSLGIEVKTLNKLVDDLFQLSLADLNKISYIFKKIDLIGAIDIAINNIKAKNHSKAIKCSHIHTGDQLFILADPARLHQLLSNIFENSFRYTDLPGHIKIITSSKHGLIEVKIMDSAPGLSDSQLTLIFQRFYRSEASRNRAMGGAGLGLSICQHIANAHGAKIIATHSDMGGLCITLTFKEHL